MSAATERTERERAIAAPTINGQEVAAGCIVDSHAGQYGPDLLADIAESFGMTFPQAWDDPRQCRQLAETGAEPDAWEWYRESADRVEEWMNDNAVNCAVLWDDGDCFIVDTRNPFATGASTYGDPMGYGLIAWMEDNGALCERCLIDPTNSVQDARDGDPYHDDPQWSVIGFSVTGDHEEFLQCDHCYAVLVADEDETQS